MDDLRAAKMAAWMAASSAAWTVVLKDHLMAVQSVAMEQL